jgi:hypothetical protein
MRVTKMVVFFLFTTICYNVSAQQTFNWKQEHPMATLISM